MNDALNAVQREFVEGQGVPTPEPKWPKGAKKPEGTESLGHQMLREDFKEINAERVARGDEPLPGYVVTESPYGAPFPHEVGGDPVMARAYARTMGVMPKEGSAWQRFADKVINTGREMFIPMRLLKDSPSRKKLGTEVAGPSLTRTFAPVREVLRIAQGVVRNSRVVAKSTIEHILGHGMTDVEMDLLQRTIWTDELLESLLRGERGSLGGLSKEEALLHVRAEKAHLEGFVKGSPRVQGAYRRHLMVQRALARELEKLGMIAPNPRQYYMHHVVMDFMEHVHGPSLGIRSKPLAKALSTERQAAAKTPGVRRYSPAALKARERLSIRDISRDYLTVQYEYLSTTMEAMKWKEYIDLIVRDYDVRSNPAPHLPRVPENWDYVTQGAPPGYTFYDTKRGFQSLQGDTAAERIFGETLDKLGPEFAKFLGVPVENVDALLYQMGPKVPTRKLGEGVVGLPDDIAIIPKELAETLREVAGNKRGMFGIADKLMANYMGWFKNIVLHKNPLQYNLRNAVGDFERAYAQFGHEMLDVDTMRDTYNEIVRAYRGDLSPFMRRMQELNVTSSGRTAVEVRAFRQSPEFDKIFGREGVKADIGSVKKILNILPRLSTAREDFFRVYIAKMNQKRILSGTKPILRGVVDISGLEQHPQLAVAKIARESLIDYGNFTPFENSLRNSLMPFYAWASGNLAFWPRLAKEVWMGSIPAGQASSVAAAQGTATLVGLALAARLWNDKLMGDAERALPQHVQQQSHIILPDPSDPSRPWLKTDEDGVERVVSIAIPTASDDFLEMMGWDGIIPELKHVLAGRMGAKEYLTRQGQEAILGPTRGVLNQLGPTVGTAAAAFGYQLFPDPLNPREIPTGERVDYMLAATGLSGFPGVDTPGKRSLPRLSPNPVEVGKSLVSDVVLPQLGVRQDVPAKEDPFVEETRLKAVRLRTEIDELSQAIRRFKGRVRGKNLPPVQRQEQIARMEANRRTLIAEFRRMVDRIHAIDRTKTRLELGGN